jgi:hypothetical protein
MADDQSSKRRQYYTRRTAVELIQQTFGIPVTESRFDKDSMVDADRMTPAPRPIATYGRRTHLYSEEQVLRYGESLIAELGSDQQNAA